MWRSQAVATNSLLMILLPARSDSPQSLRRSPLRSKILAIVLVVVVVFVAVIAVAQPDREGCTGLPAVPAAMRRGRW